MNKLNKVYQALSNGQLSQREAIARIKAIKQSEEGSASGTVLAKFEWQPTEDLSSEVVSNDELEHHVFLCELPGFNLHELSKKLPKSTCDQFRSQGENLAEDYLEVSKQVFGKTQSILRQKPQGRIVIQIVIANDSQAALYSGLSGLLKTATAENPNIFGQIIAVNPTTVDVLATRLIQEKSSSTNSLVKYDTAARYVKNCIEISSQVTVGPSWFERHGAFKNNGVYLITGGLGGLGKLFANEIASKTANATIILTGRSELSQSIIETISQLNRGRDGTATGARIAYEQLDLKDFRKVKALVDEIRKNHGALNGIIHAAGMNSDNFIIKKTTKEFVEVLTPKVIGAYHLDQACNQEALDFFVLFSSVASWFGNVGQADYSTANGFMDEFAVYRNQLTKDNQRTGITLSINWPLWQSGGMQIEQTASELLQKTMGVKPLPTSSGMRSFYRSLTAYSDQVLVMEGELTKLRQALLTQAKIPDNSFTNKQIETTSNTKLQYGDKTEPLLLEDKTQEYMCKQLSIILKMPAHKIDARAPLEKYGIDSIMAINLTNQLEKDFGSLPKTLFFEYQTISELTKYFIESFSSKLSKLFFLDDKSNLETASNNVDFNSNKTVAIHGKTAVQKSKLNPTRGLKRKNKVSIPASSTQTSSVFPQQNAKNESIAIVGLSGRYPEARDLEQFWSNLSEGKDCIVEVPESRWNWKELYTDDRTQVGKHFSKWGGFIEGVELFDPLFFNISPKEAKTIDPQERLFLQHAWCAVEDAGFTHDSLQIPHDDDASGQVGVYVGVMYGEYNLSGSLASIANRVSYFLNLHGPSITLDTMCSSSLTAIHLACQDLKEGRTDLSIAGGVNISVHPGKYLMLSEAQFISTTGSCQSFGEGGDGYIPGEGVGVTVLQRLTDAISENRHIYGVIKGSASNHGGKTNGFSVPNLNAQSNVISRAIKEANINPRHISYIEAHGTGTKLGDPIEIAALTKAFNRSSNSGSNENVSKEHGYCLLGSAKSNIGHCESAAGIAGLTKILLQMKHKQIVPSLHSKKLNPHINFDETPFIVNQELKEWSRPIVDGQTLPRIAGLSSFGAGGSNAHLIIEEFVKTTAGGKGITVENANEQYVVPLSAKNTGQLEQKINELLNYLKSNSDDLTIDSVAYTLQVGRVSMNERIGILASSVDQLVEKLEGIKHKSDDLDDVFFGEAKKHGDTLSIFSADADLRSTVDKWFSTQQYRKLVELWAKGLELDWSKLYVNQTPSFISLPTYPFAQGKYWIDPVEAPYSHLSRDRVSGVIHPLIHRNTSNLEHISFETIVDGQEGYLKENQEGVKALPKAIYLEMLDVLFNQVLGGDEKNQSVELTDVAWGEDALVSDKQSVSIELFERSRTQVDFEFFNKSDSNDSVYCQGHAHIKPLSELEFIDLEALKLSLKPAENLKNNDNIVLVYAGENQALIKLHYPEPSNNKNEVSLTSFKMVDWVLECSLGILNVNGPKAVVDSVDSFRVHKNCSSEMYVWIKGFNKTILHDEEIKLDVQLFTLTGELCLEMKCVYLTHVEKNQPVQIPHDLQRDVPERGFSKSESIKLDDRVAVPMENDAKKVVLTNPIVLAGNINKKPQHVALKQPSKSISKLTAVSAVLEDKPKINFDSRLAEGFDSQRIQTAINVYRRDENIVVIELNDSINKNQLSNDNLNGFVDALQSIKLDQKVRVLLIKGVPNEFIHGGRELINQSIKASLLNIIASFPVPVISVMQGNASGIGMLIAAVSDFMLCSNQSHYQFNDPLTATYLTSNEVNLFDQRLGHVLSNHLLCSSKALSGKELKEAGWSCQIIDKLHIDTVADELAIKLSSKTGQALKLLKQHLSFESREAASNLTNVQVESPNQPEVSLNQNVKKLGVLARWLSFSTANDDVLIVTIKRVTKKFTIAELVSDLTRSLIDASTSLKPKSIIFQSSNKEFLPVKLSRVTTDEIATLFECILSIPVPVVAALANNANGFSWILAQFCTVCIYNSKGNYSLAGLTESESEKLRAGPAFEWHFGLSATKRVLFESKSYSGNELKELQPTLLVADKKNVNKQATEVARLYTKIPTTTLSNRANKQKTEFASAINQFKTFSPNELESKTELENQYVSADKKESKKIPLKSEVVKTTLSASGVLLVRMEDRRAKNTFTDELISGLNEVFQYVEKSADCKVVILTGYGNYFSSGGTKESLLAIQKGLTKFTDTQAFHLAMDCKLPVISAFNGHAIGAGLTLGLFADFSIFSEQSQYISPYMNYGFTPGAGATFILPKRLGFDFARESLFLAEEISGAELRRRLPHNLYSSRDDVVSDASELASLLARSSRSLLVALKQQWTKKSEKLLNKALDEEVLMHEKTFVGKDDTLQKINHKFLSEAKLAQQNQKTQGTVSETLKPITPFQTESLGSITDTIKQLLAVELHLDLVDIDETAQFIDLGLDSITGVTWVKKINQRYQLGLDATKVYSSPTLEEFAQLVKKECAKQQSTPEKVLEQVPNKQTIASSHKSVITNSIANSNVATNHTLSEVSSFVKSQLAEELHLDQLDIDEDAQFIDLGLDSITGVTLVRKINQNYNSKIEATNIYSYPTLTEFSRYVFEQLEKSVTKEGSTLATSRSSETRMVDIKKPVLYSSEKNQAAVFLNGNKLTSWRSERVGRLRSHASRHQNQAIAVIGMAGQFPGASGLEQYWKNISQGKNCISEAPAERWNMNEIFQAGAPTIGKTNSKWIGALEGYDMFDPLFFTISPTEAETMDPQQRLFLQACWHGIENAGYNAQDFSGTKCGVFVGCAAGDYNLISREQQTSAQGFTGGATSILAARISYFLNLQGPCISIDTACSSSLVAIASACESLNSESSDLALAGGVYVMSRPDMLIKTSQSGMLSTDGRCFSFDQRANGFVAGEGVGVVLLKRLSDAQNDNDIIQGVIKGWGINQDGKTNGITAPNAESQTRLEQDVYDNFDIDPADIQLVEAHGTGTKLGDPIEIEGLKNAFRKYTDNQNYCAVGSVKSNIGHCLTAAGIAGIIKLILAFKHKQLPPTINYEKQNEHIGLDSSPFYISNKLKEWKVQENQTRQAAISSFGFSGTNAHMVLTEYQAPKNIRKPSTKLRADALFVIPLSARNSDRLKQKASDLIDWLQRPAKDIDLLELAFTLQVGREPMESRLAVIVSNLEQLVDKLKMFIADQSANITSLYSGQVKRNKEGINIISQDKEVRDALIANWVVQKNLAKLVNVWVKGLAFDWNVLYEKITPKRIELPNYPFAEERYWLEASVQEPQTSSQNSSNLHPLLHDKTIDLSEQFNDDSLTGYKVSVSNSAQAKGQEDSQLPQLIELPTYPFLRERCWVEAISEIVNQTPEPPVSNDFESIREIIEQVDSGKIETDNAIKRLKQLA